MNSAGDLPDYAPIPRSALGPALNDQGYYVGRVERNLYWVTDGTYQSAFLTTRDGVVLLDAPPTIGHNLRRAVDEIASANGVSNKVTHLIYSHHHADHVGASALFDKGIVRIGHEETRRLLLRDNDPARPAPEETFADRRTLNIGGERIELAWHGPNHSPDNTFIHLPDHDALMLVDIVNPGWVPTPKKRDVAIEWRFDEDLPIVSADRTQILQVFINLILNAIEAVEDSRVVPRVIVRAFTADRDQMLIQVTDNGPGVGDPERIFDAFVTTKKNGMGIGLAVSRSIIETHGGRLWAENHPEGGAIFTVALPLRAVQSKSSSTLNDTRRP